MILATLQRVGFDVAAGSNHAVRGLVVCCCVISLSVASTSAFAGRTFVTPKNTKTVPSSGPHSNISNLGVANTGKVTFDVTSRVDASTANGVSQRLVKKQVIIPTGSNALPTRAKAFGAGALAACSFVSLGTCAALFGGAVLGAVAVGGLFQMVFDVTTGRLNALLPNSKAVVPTADEHATADLLLLPDGAYTYRPSGCGGQPVDYTSLALAQAAVDACHSVCSIGPWYSSGQTLSGNCGSATGKTVPENQYVGCCVSGMPATGAFGIFVHAVPTFPDRPDDNMYGDLDCTPTTFIGVYASPRKLGCALREARQRYGLEDDESIAMPIPDEDVLLAIASDDARARDFLNRVLRPDYRRFVNGRPYYFPWHDLFVPTDSTATETLSDTDTDSVAVSETDGKIAELLAEQRNRELADEQAAAAALAETVDVPHTLIDVGSTGFITPIDLGIASTCPTLRLTYPTAKTINLRPVCGMAGNARPLVIAFAWLFAFVIIYKAVA